METLKEQANKARAYFRKLLERASDEDIVAFFAVWEGFREDFESRKKDDKSKPMKEHRGSRFLDKS